MYDVFESSGDENDDEPWQVTLPDDYNADFGDSVSDAISKVRAIVKVFRESPLKNDCLQKNCEKKFGKNSLCSWIPKLDGTHCSRCLHDSWNSRHLLTIH